MTDFSLSITKWYRLNYRALPWRETTNPYFIWLSEIILQQTRVDQGLSYYLKFTKKYPTVSDLANAEEQEILNDWQGLGYYSRARNLHASAKYILDDLNGVFPDTYMDILKLKGVGDYTASAVASFAFNEAEAVVDGNVYRLLGRFFNVDIPIDSPQGKKYFKELATELLDKKNPGEHNQAIMEFGATVCSPKPKCLECVLNERCLAYENDTVSDRPLKEKKLKTRDRHFHYFIYHHSNKIVLNKRVNKDIWQNMYDFPLVETIDGDKDILEELIKTQTKESNKIIHILSHQKIHAVFHHFNQLPDEFDSKWLLVNEDKIQDYPLPRLIDRYINDHGI